MPTCARCGEENPDRARFCLACGAALDAAHEPPAQEERRIVSVVFVDLVGFTSRSEKLDPEDAQAILSPYHETVRQELESYGGRVEKFIGDAIVAVFGAPTAYGDDPERAVRAALSVAQAVGELDERLRLDLQIRIAVNTGGALVNLGARIERGEPMVAGDVMNTASRLQSAAPVNGVLAGALTYAATKEVIAYEPTPPIEAKGKAEPVEAWIAIGELLPAGERRQSGQLVGRSYELEVLRGIWERSAGERAPHLVTVLGPAGIGKTRLTQEFERTVRESGGRSVHGRSLPYRESSAYFAFSVQVKQLCGIFESDPPEIAIPKLRAQVESLPSAVDVDTVTEHLAILMGLDMTGVIENREDLFFSVRCFIEGIAHDQPTLLVFEDVHWADRGLLDLIELLAARLRDLPILVLALARPDLLDLRPAWGGGLTAYTALPLAPLNDDESAELSAQLLGKVQEERISRLAEMAEGNPLFIEQLAATVAESGSPGGGELPTTIRGIVAARLDALPPDERSLMLEAAVVGKTFWRGALENMGHGEELGELLGALELRDLISRDTSAIIEGQAQYAFKHVLIREVAYELLPRARRRELHGHVAEFFEEATNDLGEAAAALARHWRDAGEPVRALDYFIRAAEQAEHGWAKDQAALLYREALDLVPADDGVSLRDVRKRIALARAAAVHIPDARQLIRES